MSVVDRLRQLDDRVFPNTHRWRDKYDRPVPQWMQFGSVFGSGLGVAGVFGATQTGGLTRVLILVVLGLALATFTLSVLRWQKIHRLWK